MLMVVRFVFIDVNSLSEDRNVNFIYLAVTVFIYTLSLIYFVGLIKVDRDFINEKARKVLVICKFNEVLLEKEN
jgi:hypothetical protein